jgi:hypothetical protein
LASREEGRSRSRRQTQAVLKDAVETAERFDVALRTTTRADDDSQAAILREARRGGHTLIVMGVDRRPGDTLFFGDVAEAVLAQSDCSILFVAGESAAAPRAGYGKHRSASDQAPTPESGIGGSIAAAAPSSEAS